MTRCDACRDGAINTYEALRTVIHTRIRASAGHIGTHALTGAKAALLNIHTHHQAHKATCQHAKEATA